MIQMNLFTNKNRLMDIENKFMVTKGERGGRDKFGISRNTTYKIVYIKIK